MLQLFPNKILWLASYPKSGNTWFRAFLSALLDEGEVDINRMNSDGIFSSREIIDACADISSRDLYDDEVKLILPDVYRYYAAEKKTLSIIKVHDNFGYNKSGTKLIPEDVTHCAIYLIRNPLDVAGSLANHMNSSIQEAVDMLNNKKAYMARQRKNLNTNIQTRQFLSDWSSHVHSWVTLPNFPVYVVRYEDMLANTFDTFKKVLDVINLPYSDEKIRKAIQASSFDILSKQESEKGFREKAPRSARFFRAGKAGNWEKELNEQQINQLMSMHNNTMKKYGY